MREAIQRYCDRITEIRSADHTNQEFRDIVQSCLCEIARLSVSRMRHLCDIAVGHAAMQTRNEIGGKL